MTLASPGVGRPSSGLQLPELEQPCGRSVVCRKENMSVEEQAVHLFWPLMRDRIAINAELLHFFTRPAVLIRGRAGGEKKFRFALGVVLVYRKDHRGPIQIPAH